ncbi:P-loop containing nucleoside triphosphate hydrolase protein [Phlyctochytrium arcticum]|nr:P-loop containing nucleoside triphosphate hydrolase protein [Phlyctochytrium arcticum]
MLKPLESKASQQCVAFHPQSPNSVQITDPSGGRRGTKNFAFDAVFGQDVGTEEVYERMVRGVVRQCLAGYNGCVLAYGQTASGKTYTMEGHKPTAFHGPPIEPSERGIILRVAADVGESGESDPDVTTQFIVKASYLEIYQETLSDLLCDMDEGPADLRIRMDPDSLSGRELYVQGLTEREVVGLDDYIRVVHTGSRRRTVGETNMNDVSSRSHAVLTLTIEQVKRRKGVLEGDGIESRKRSKIHLVDLAGSERATATGATGVRLREGGSINQSLLALGNVISALSSRSSTPSSSSTSSDHVSYRDSKLTWLLSDSLGGNALTVMLACLTPSATNYEESLSTLRFAERAKKVALQARVNVDSHSLRILTLQAEIDCLRNIVEGRKSAVAMRDASTTTLIGDEANELADADRRGRRSFKPWLRIKAAVEGAKQKWQTLTISSLATKDSSTPTSEPTSTCSSPMKTPAHRPVNLDGDNLSYWGKRAHRRVGVAAQGIPLTESQRQDVGC